MAAPIIDTDNTDILQSGGYAGAAYLIIGPQTPIFAARVNGSITTVTSFAEVTYDTVTTGAYTDVTEGMTVYVSRTNDIRQSYFSERVRKVPTSSILYIGEVSKAVTDNDYIWVVPSYGIWKKQRRGAYVDWDIAYAKLPPIVKNMDSAYVKLTTASTATFSFSPVGQAVDDTATSTITYSWSISGATYTSGSSSSQNITVQVNTPYNAFAKLTITDSNGVSNWFAFTITAGDPNNNAHTFFRLCHTPIPITADWSNGYSSNVAFWRGMDDVLDGSRITIVTDESFNDGPLDGMPNVAFVGYLQAASINIEGDEVYGQRKEVSFEMSGLLQLAGEVRCNPIAIRHKTNPTKWDEIKAPNPMRNLVHLLARHSTILNLCAIDLGTIDSTFFSGNSDINETSLMDAARRVADEIKAYITQEAAGHLSFERDPRLTDDAFRDALDVATFAPINLGDVLSYEMSDNPREKVGSVEVGFACYNSATGNRFYLTANGPSSGFGDSQAQETFPNQLLEANSDLAAAKTEAGERTGNLLALTNLRRKLKITFAPGWASVINPSPGAWYQFEVDAADDPRGIGIDPDDRWLCVSKSVTINETGTQDITCDFEEETQGGSSLIKVSYSPSVVTTELPVLPARSVIPAFPSAPSLNYDSTDPTNRQRRDPFDGMMGAPMTPEEAAEAAANQSTPGCRTVGTNFKTATNASAGFTTVNGADYTITASGSAQIGTAGGAIITYDFTASDQGFTPITANQGIYHAGQGWGRGIDTGRIGIEKDLNQTFVAATITYNEVLATSGRFVRVYEYPFPSTQIGSDTTAQSIYNFTYAAADGFSMDSGHSGSLSTTLRLTSIALTQPGSGDPVYADAFYSWEEVDGEPVNVQLLSGEGLYLAGSSVDVGNPVDLADIPPFDPNHSYTFTWTAGGNPFYYRFQTDDYSSVQSSILRLNICGANAGE